MLLLFISISKKAINTNITTIEVSLFYVLLGKILGRFILNRLNSSLADLVLSESQYSLVKALWT